MLTELSLRFLSAQRYLYLTQYLLSALHKAYNLVSLFQLFENICLVISMQDNFMSVI